MKSIDELGQVISTDVLVIGGGISGLVAAIKAKEKQVDVLVVDKGGIGWAGCAPIAGGPMMFVQPEAVEEWFKWAVAAGDYLNNQDWTYAVGSDNYEAVTELAEWGAPFLKTADGKVAHVVYQATYPITVIAPEKFNIKLKQAALSRGVRTLDKIYMVDLLRRDGRVTGAIGLGLVDGKTYIIKAKATIIANGGCMSKQDRWFSVNAGEGVAMAYRAGAELMNAEICNTYAYGFRLGEFFSRQPMYLFYENALGERIMGKYYPELMDGLKFGQERENFWKIADSMVKEVEAGRGPIYINFGKLTPEELNVALRRERRFPAEFMSIRRIGSDSDIRKFFRERCGVDLDKEKAEVLPVLHNMAGPVRVGVDGKTTVDGLWAAGDACHVGSSFSGANPEGTYPGEGLAFAMISGRRAGRSAGEYAATSSEAHPEYGEVNKSIERLLAPLGRKGTIGSHEVIYRIQEATTPVKYSLRREAGRLKESLAMIDTAKQTLPMVGAKDYHELMLYHQTEAITLCAGWCMKASLMREETRGQHMRVDYPNRNDKDWLKWIIIKEEEGETRFSTEPVPIERYRLKPPAA